MLWVFTTHRLRHGSGARCPGVRSCRGFPRSSVHQLFADTEHAVSTDTVLASNLRVNVANVGPQVAGFYRAAEGRLRIVFHIGNI